jgi:selenocysteine lyase/cysteine desulfurase
MTGTTNGLNIPGPTEYPDRSATPLRTVAQAATLWDVEPGYLNTSSYGPPPRPGWDALQEALDDWRLGRTGWEPWAQAVEVSRRRFADLVGVAAEQVATGAAVSQLIAPIATALPDGSRVLTPDIEFTSAVFPFAAHADRGVTVTTAPAASLADTIDRNVDVVVYSAVQSATGEVADIDAITAAARAVGALTVLDTSQATGWLRVDPDAADLQVCAAYKWLCSPRGTAFLVHHPTLADRHPGIEARLKPLAAGWFAGEDIHGTYYGLPLRLAPDARRFDISPAWHCWVGAAPALEVLASAGVTAIGRHNIGLANHFLAATGHPASNSAIVSVPADQAAVDRLTGAGVRFGVRAGRVRMAFHLYSTVADVELAVAALTG